MTVAGFSSAGPRAVNEDNFFVLDFSEVHSFSGGLSSFIMVSDGMGGYEGGDIASSIATQAAEHYLNHLMEMADNNQIELDVPQAFKEIVGNANEAIICEMRNRNKTSMGATFVGAFISPRKAWVAHVGDSRAYLVHRGVAKQITKDHSAVGRMLSDGLITEKQAQNHPERNVIERALGFSDEEPEITEVFLGRGDALLLCSDGVSTVLNTKMIADCVMQAENAQKAAEGIVAMAIKRNTDDNATAVISTGNWNTLKTQTAVANRRSRHKKDDKNSPKGTRTRRSSTKNLTIIIMLVIVLITGLIIGISIGLNVFGNASQEVYLSVEDTGTVDEEGYIVDESDIGDDHGEEQPIE